MVNGITHPHEIQIDLGSAYALNTLDHSCRQDGYSNGRIISNYAISVSGSGVDWEFPVAMGSFATRSCLHPRWDVSFGS